VVIVEERKMKIAGFGNFEVKRKQYRRGRNRRQVRRNHHRHSILTYHPSVVLKNMLNGINKAE
jgi:integration host factor subunit alpha